MIIIGLIFLIAIYSLIVNKNLIKKLMCLNIIEYMIILLFIKQDKIKINTAPILPINNNDIMSDPLPQALMLTAIVISLCFNVIASIFILKIYKDKGSIDIDKIE